MNITHGRGVVNQNEAFRLTTALHECPLVHQFRTKTYEKCLSWTSSRLLRATGRGCVDTSGQPPTGLVYGGGSFWGLGLPLGVGLLKKNDVKKSMMVVTEREAHAGWPCGGLIHGNGASVPGVFFGGRPREVDMLPLRTGCREVVLGVSATGVSGCGGSNWNRKLEAHTSTSYSNTCDDA